MDFLPKTLTLGTRPRLAVEIRAEGVVAARAEDAAALLTGAAKSGLAEGAVVPGLKAGNIVETTAVVAAVRKALDGVASSGRERQRDVTLVVPDASVRVLFLEFDELSSKAAEALPVVRFRLKKLLPFDADQAAVSYQVMSSAKGLIKVLAVAMPKDVLAEYEGVVTAAGYLPGAVLPSTLATLAGLGESDAAALVVNAGQHEVTTAIVKAGVLLLHRSMDMGGDMSGDTTGADSGPGSAGVSAMTLVDRESSAQEWAKQEPLGPEGWDRLDAETAMQSAVLTEELREMASTGLAREVAQAVSVAAAYFEDTLESSPELVYAAGTLGAERLAGMMEASGFEGLRVQEMVDAGMMQAGAVTASVPRSWLAGVRGALRG